MASLAHSATFSGGGGGGRGKGVRGTGGGGAGHAYVPAPAPPVAAQSASGFGGGEQAAGGTGELAELLGGGEGPAGVIGAAGVPPPRLERLVELLNLESAGSAGAGSAGEGASSAGAGAGVGAGAGADVGAGARAGGGSEGGGGGGGLSLEGEGDGGGGLSLEGEDDGFEERGLGWFADEDDDGGSVGAKDAGAGNDPLELRVLQPKLLPCANCGRAGNVSGIAAAASEGTLLGARSCRDHIQATARLLGSRRVNCAQQFPQSHRVGPLRLFPGP